MSVLFPATLKLKKDKINKPKADDKATDPLVAIDQNEKKVPVSRCPPRAVSKSTKSAWIDAGMAKSALNAVPPNKQIKKKAIKSPEPTKMTKENTTDA